MKQLNERALINYYYLSAFPYPTAGSYSLQNKKHKTTMIDAKETPKRKNTQESVSHAIKAIVAGKNIEIIVESLLERY